MLSPNEYLEYYKTGIYQLKDIVEESEYVKYKIETIKDDRKYVEE